MDTCITCCGYVAVLVTLHLDIKRDAREGELQSFNCPARKPLINVVRPMLHRTLPPTSVTRGDRVLVKLDITGASDDIVWTSQAQKFVVSFVFLYVSVVIVTAGDDAKCYV